MPDVVAVGGLFVGCNRNPHVLDWSPQSDLIAFGGSTDICLVNAKLNRCEQLPFHISDSFKYHSKAITSVRWVKHCSGVSACLVCASEDGSCSLWQFVDGKLHFIAELDKRSGSMTFATGIQRQSGEIVTVCVGTDSTLTLSSGLIQDNVWCTNGLLSLETHKNGLIFCADFTEMKSSVCLAVGCDDNKIRIFASEQNIEDFRLTQMLAGHTDWVRGVSFGVGGDGDIMLASCSQDSYIRIWRIKVEQQSTANLSQDIKLSGQIFQVGDVSCHVTLDAVLSGHEDWVYSVIWHPHLKDGKTQLLSASMDKCLVVWEPDPESGVWLEKARLGDVGGNALGFYGCAYSVDGLTVIGHSYQGGLSMWSVVGDSWEPQVVSTGHFGSVEDLVWDPAGNYILSCSADQTTRLFAPWNQRLKRVTYHELARPQIHGHNLQCLTAVNSLNFVSGAEEKILRSFRAPSNFISNMKTIAKTEFSPDLLRGELPEGASVPALGLSNKAVMKAETSVVSTEVSSEANELYPVVVFQPYVSCVPPTEDVLMQNTLWPEIHKLYGHGYELYAVASNHTGTIVASACKASRLDHAAVTIWNTANWTSVCKLEAHSLTVTQIVFAPNDSLLLTVSRDRTWALFRRESSDFVWSKCGQSDKRTGLHSRIIWGAAWAPDSQHFVTVARDKKVILWKMADPTTAVSQLSLGESVTAVDVATLSFKTFRFLVAVGLENGLVYLYTVEEDLQFRERWKDQSHSMTVKRVKFRPLRGLMGVEDSDDFLQLATCGEDHFVRLINIRLDVLDM